MTVIIDTTFFMLFTCLLIWTTAVQLVPISMQITRAADYAVRVMIHLASLPSGATVQHSEIAEATEVPQSFLSKVLQQLVQAGMISSRRGAGGGFRLATAANKISILNILEVIEGPTRLNVCLEPGLSCGRKAWCSAHAVWVEAQWALENVLQRASIAELARQARRNMVREREARAAR